MLYSSIRRGKLWEDAHLVEAIVCIDLLGVAAHVLMAADHPHRSAFLVGILQEQSVFNNPDHRIVSCNCTHQDSILHECRL
jgi:hypothetical protein